MRLLLPFALVLSACGDKEPAEDKQDDTHTETDTEPQDADGDGFALAEECDAADSGVGGAERPFDGVDSDCDPSTPDDDGDGDGIAVADDCDAADPLGWLPPEEYVGDVKWGLWSFAPGAASGAFAETSASSTTLV